MKEIKHKDFSNEIAIIIKNKNFKKQEVVLETGRKKAFLTKTKNDYQLYFDGIFPYDGTKKLKVRMDGEQYTLKSADFKEPMHSGLAAIPAQHTFDVESISKGSINNATFFKMFFFDDSQKTNIFYSKVETIRAYGHSFNCIQLCVLQKRYEITQHTEEDQSYFIIENLDEVSLQDFEDNAYAIQKGIGFLVGYMPGGENYIFAEENFLYKGLSRKSLKSIYHPVTSNPYSRLHEESEREIADHYYGKIKVVPVAVISELVIQVQQNMDFSVAMILLMEVSSLKSVVSMPGVFSLILESLANCIIIKEEKVEKLIDDKDLSDTIISNLNLVIDNYINQISQDAATKIRRRLHEINKPINYKRLTNAEKLRAPFDQLKIILTKEDEKAINYRNALLHGKILMNGEVKRTSEEIDDHMMYISAKLYTLLSKLILKMCGYEGYVINHSKFYERNSIKTTEEYFNKI
ncbi:hypothetical protein [Flavobacterium frigidarium]|uniref:ApeA N-terminal domain-containing protein n=1 Tax=Flavobacterium frigidarium TaxID=99286 RepID=A0ABV4KHX0_9FLAO